MTYASTLYLGTTGTSQTISIKTLGDNKYNIEKVMLSLRSTSIQLNIEVDQCSNFDSVIAVKWTENTHPFFKTLSTSGHQMSCLWLGGRVTQDQC